MKCPCCDRSLREHGWPSVILDRATPEAPEPPKSPRGTNEWMERELLGYAMHQMGAEFVSTTTIYDWYVEQGWSLTQKGEGTIMLLEMGKEGPWRREPMIL